MLMEIIFGGSIWESNPPTTISRNTVLKTGRHTSYLSASINIQIVDCLQSTFILYHFFLSYQESVFYIINTLYFIFL